MHRNLCADDVLYIVCYPDLKRYTAADHWIIIIEKGKS